MKDPLRRILCVGRDLFLLESRCAVLNWAGHESTYASPEDAAERMGAGDFDLIVVSMMLPDAETRSILAAAPATAQTLILDHMLSPEELLAIAAEPGRYTANTRAPAQRVGALTASQSSAFDAA